MTPQSHYRCWVEIDLESLRQNVSAIRRRIGSQAGLVAVVKADAYGHGLPQVARVLMELGVDGFAVADLTEALAIRHLGGNGWPILLFGSALPFEIPKIIEQQIIPTISTVEEANQFEAAAAAANQQIDVQIEIDTGMGRVGFWHEDAPAAIRQVASLPHLRIRGVYTHFPSADENRSETIREFNLYQDIISRLRQGEIEVGACHAANSAALLSLPETVLDLVRPGLILYGIQPPANPAAGGPRHGDFSPVLSFKARVAFVKNVTPGRTISYGQTFIAPSPMTIATVAAGYGDGFSRNLSNHAQVLVNGRRCPVVGRVTMDQIMVDITGLGDTAVGDEVVFIGRQGNEEITALEVARWANTIPWEVLCGITKSARVRRVYRGLHAA